MTTNTYRFADDKADQERNDAIYPRVVDGDPEAIEEMIVTNQALVVYKANACANEFTNINWLLEDMISAGMVALVEAVNSMVGKEVEEPNPTGLISQYIYFALGDLCDRETTIRVPSSTNRMRKVRGMEKIETPRRQASVGVGFVLDQEGVTDPRALPELWDSIYGACKTENDRAIVRLRSEGYTDQEISDKVGIARSSVHFLRRAIYERFLEANPEIKGEV